MKQLNKVRANLSKKNEAIDIIERLYEIEWIKVKDLHKRFWVSKTTITNICRWAITIKTADKILEAEFKA